MDRILQCGDVIMDMNQMCAALCVHRWLHWLHWASNQPGLAIAGLVPGPDFLFPTSCSSARLDQLQTLQTTLYSHYGKQSALILVIRAQLSANHTAVNICCRENDAQWLHLSLEIDWKSQQNSEFVAYTIVSFMFYDYPKWCKKSCNWILRWGDRFSAFL